MSPNSKTASQLRLGKTKCAYTILYRIARYVTDVLNDALQEVSVYSLTFDESHNRVLRKSQKDLLIRYWDDSSDMVSTRYCDSTCLGKAAATDVFEKFNSIAKNLDTSKFSQVMSDGPNVNKLFLNLLAETSEEEQRSRLVDLGIPMYKIFDESPVRRADYEKITTAIERDCALQVCSQRWIEMQGWLKEPRMFWKYTYKLLIFGKLCQKVSNQAKASQELTRFMILC